MVELPGRGETYVTDVPGPEPDSPTVLLLHAVGCTGLLTWFPAIGALSERYRVVTLDQRWHGRGIQSDEFSLYDCADDAAALLDVLGIEQAIVAGFSMGSIVAQRVWRQHPDRMSGLVLCATTDRFRRSTSERVFHQGMELGDARDPQRLPLAYGGARGAHSRRGARPHPRRHPRLGAPGVAQHQPVGGRSGRGRAGPAPLASVAVADRRPHRGRGHHEGPGDPRGAPARRGPPDPGRHHPRHRRRPRRLRAGVGGVRARFVEAVATVNARRRDFRSIGW